MLRGREAERAHIGAMLDAARRGTGGALVLVGEPGIGKTALLGQIARDAVGFRVLRAMPVEAEARLPFAGLAELVTPLLADLASVPPTRAAALQAALGLGPPAVADRFAAYSAALGLLQAVAVREPLLVLLDDAHWLDEPSAEALAFCARRLDGHRVALVAAVRREEAAPVAAALPALELGPLDLTAAREVLREVAGPDLGAAVREQLLTVAAGNPLALVELPRQLTAAELRGFVPLREPLPASGAVLAAFDRRIGALGPAARRAALLLAASADGALAAIAPALAPLSPEVGLGELEASRLVVIEGDRARFTHPLMRSAALTLAAPAERRDAHRALARVLDAEAHAEERAWHLAAAALGPDDAAAAALEAAAGRAAGRTAYADAARALARAAELSTAPPDRARRLMSGAGAAHMAGRPELAAGMLERVLQLVDDPLARAHATHLLGLAVMTTGHLDRACRVLAQGADDVLAVDPGKAAELLADATLTRTMAGRCDEALSYSARAVAFAPGHPHVMAYRGSSLVLAGRMREARPLFAALDARLGDLDPLSPASLALVITFLPRVWVEDFEAARAQVDRWITAAREAGAEGVLAFPLALACELRFRTGDWRRAEADGREAVRLLVETDQYAPLSYALTALATVEGAMGREAACRDGVARALALTDRHGTGSVVTYAAAALGLLELGRGDPEAAARHLAPLPEFTRARGLREPATVMWQPDLIEALITLGRRAEARAQLAALAEAAYATDATWGRAVTCRLRGLMDAGDGEPHFREALRWHDRAPMPFERARTQLAYGERLRRARRRARAREQLRAALETFESLGASPWVERARAELAACGPSADAPAGALSPRERAVALAVAGGSTNREVAARLFVSEKTVERHLGQIFRKLGVRSRTELARSFATDEARFLVSEAG